MEQSVVTRQDSVRYNTHGMKLRAGETYGKANGHGVKVSIIELNDVTGEVVFDTIFSNGKKQRSDSTIDLLVGEFKRSGKVRLYPSVNSTFAA
jgi:hypothetical protein